MGQTGAELTSFQPLMFQKTKPRFAGACGFPWLARKGWLWTWTPAGVYQYMQVQTQEYQPIQVRQIPNWAPVSFSQTKTDQSSEGVGPFPCKCERIMCWAGSTRTRKLATLIVPMAWFMAHWDLSNPCRSTQKKLRRFAGKLRRFAGKLRRFKKCFFAKIFLVLQTISFFVVLGKWTVKKDHRLKVLQSSPYFANFPQTLIWGSHLFHTNPQTSAKPLVQSRVR